MRLIWRTLVLASSVIMLVACGGSGGGGSSTNNVYAGSYQGMYLQSKDGTLGTVNLTITSAGAISGTSVQTGQTPTTLTGTINNSGSVTIVSSSGGTSNTSTGTFSPVAGALTIDAALTQGTNTIWVILVVHPAAGVTGANPFAGDYAGTQTNTTTNLTGINAISINSAGVVAGNALISVNGVPTLTTLSGTITNAGAITYTLSVGGTVETTVTGNLALQQGTNLAGSLTNSASQTISFSDNTVV